MGLLNEKKNMFFNLRKFLCYFFDELISFVFFSRSVFLSQTPSS